MAGHGPQRAARFLSSLRRNVTATPKPVFEQVPAPTQPKLQQAPANQTQTAPQLQQSAKGVRTKEDAERFFKGIGL